MTETTTDPPYGGPGHDGSGGVHDGLGPGGGQKLSYSERLKTNVRYDQKLKRNVLEITLEKTDTKADIDRVDDDDIARVLKTLGIDISSQTQGFQLHYKGRVSIISVWMAAGINLERFCKEVNIKVTKGVMTGMIRPAGRTDVTVKVEGLDFNTPDNFVIDYINKFGTVKSNVVVYTKYESGPFKGKYNGIRQYQVDFTKAKLQMGTFHLIDGSKVRVFYRGNRKTCGRCHKLASECPGEAIARNCEAGGGARVYLSDHMKKLWETIGFVPASFELNHDDKAEDDLHQAVKDAIIPEKQFPTKTALQEPSHRDIDLSDGIIIKNLPDHLATNQIITFLLNHGMPLDHHEVENVHINKEGKNTKVTIEGLSPTSVQTMIKSIHFHESKTKFFGVPLYCTAVRNLTPKKKEVDGAPDESAEKDEPKMVEKPNTSTKEKTDAVATTKTDNPPKPKIPGLSEEDRLKALAKKSDKKKRKSKNKQKKDEDEPVKDLTKDDFLKSPNSGLRKEPEDNLHGFVFDESSHEESETEDEFEDSNDFPSEDDDASKPTDIPAESVSKTSTPSTSSNAAKRPAKSPANANKTKKSRSRSLSVIPKKK